MANTMANTISDAIFILNFQSVVAGPTRRRIGPALPQNAQEARVLRNVCGAGADDDLKSGIHQRGYE
jgi:hypothetical protein